VFDCSLRSLRIALGSRLISSSLADEKRVGSLLLSTAARDPVLDCSLRSLRIALGSRLFRRRSLTRSVSARFSSARRRAIRGSPENCRLKPWRLSWNWLA
jgi:hypothetical protein